MQKRIAAMAALGVALGIVLVSSVGAASEDKRTTYLTFSQPVGLPGVTLPAGTYLFEVADPLVSADIIRVSNRKRTMVYFTAWTDRVERRAGERGEIGHHLHPGATRVRPQNRRVVPAR